MSRAHDGQRSFLPFQNPFRGILPKGSTLTPKLLALQTSFEESLNVSLKKLMPEDPSEILTLSWMSQAMECLSITHASIETLTAELKLPVSDWDEKWIDVYLDSSIKLLDICIAFSAELSRLDQGRILLQYVLHVLNSTDMLSAEKLQRAHLFLHDWNSQISSRSPKLYGCPTILQSLAESLQLVKIKSSPKGTVLTRALYGVKAITILISNMLAAALLGSSKPLMELSVEHCFLWSEAFDGLQKTITQECEKRISSGNSLSFKELEAVGNCAKRLEAVTIGASCRGENGEQLDVMESSKSNMEQSFEKFKAEVEMFSKRVEDFFQIVLSGRDALLGNLRMASEGGACQKL